MQRKVTTNPRRYIRYIKEVYHMKRIDFEHGTITGNILGAALPMLVAQLLSLLYNIVDRIYIARIPDVGTTALGDRKSTRLNSSH